MSRSAKLLFVSVYMLVGLGIVMTYSASAVYAESVYGYAQYFLIRQTVFVALGTLVLFITASVPFYYWRDNARAILLLAIALLLAVYVPVLGRQAGGARRWLDFGLVNFQPAEFAKVAVCLYLSDYIARKSKRVQQGGLGVFLPPMALIGIICGLIILQPDLGSCAFIAIVTLILFFVGGIRLRYVAIVATALLPVLYFLVIRVPYRLSRVTAYLNPWEDPQGSGFQMIQSFLAFGLGGAKGVGLGQSTQKLFYLPSAHNDFIFAIIGEELGFAGLFTVIVLFICIFVAGMLIASKTHDIFNRLLALSLTIFFVIQAIINMMVATGLLPTKGLPLPFISYGGTSIVMNLMAVGLILGAEINQRRRFRR